MSAVVVVGAGIVGASVAYHLARKGIGVTLLEQAPSPAAGVTGGSFAWIGDSGGHWPGGGEDLRPYVLADYRRLEAELPELSVRWTGSLTWTGSAPESIGPGQYLVGRSDIAALEPNFEIPPAQAVHTPTDGGVDPAAMTEALVRAACRHGAQVIYNATVDSLSSPPGRSQGVLSSAGFHPAATVVLATDVGAAALCGTLHIDVGVGASPACLLRIATPPALIRTIVAGPEFEVREARDGELFATMPYVDGQSAESLAQAVHSTFRRMQATFRGGSALRLLDYRVSGRPMPSNGPIVGYVTPDRSVYVAVMHSAITLAPTVGRLIAEELVSGKPAAELDRCRPQIDPRP